MRDVYGDVKTHFVDPIPRPTLTGRTPELSMECSVEPLSKEKDTSEMRTPLHLAGDHPYSFANPSNRNTSRLSTFSLTFTQTAFHYSGMLYIPLGQALKYTPQFLCNPYAILYSL